MDQQNSAYSIHPISVLQDNIIWVWVQGEEAVVIDPAIEKPVREFLLSNNLKLIAILQTHHHQDHIGGTLKLLNEWPNAEVVASEADQSRIPFQTISVCDGSKFSLMGNQVEVLSVNGHTKHHIAYFLSGIKEKRKYPVLFCGDTLFSGGCGRIFEGTPKEMYEALQRIKDLPQATRIYCAHEYTKQNLLWAVSLYPDDLAIKKRLAEVIDIRKKGHLTIPTILKEEKHINLFLKAKNLKHFTDLRKSKDVWKG